MSRASGWGIAFVAAMASGLLLTGVASAGPGPAPRQADEKGLIEPLKVIPCPSVQDWWLKVEADLSVAAELQLAYDFRPGSSDQPFTKRRGGFFETLNFLSLEVYSGDRRFSGRVTGGFYGLFDAGNHDIARFFGGSSDAGYHFNAGLQEGWGQFQWTDGNYARLGIQTFQSDHAGLIYNDSDRGVVYHGSTGLVKENPLAGYQWNVAYFAKTVDDPISQLNTGNGGNWHVIILNTYLPVFEGVQFEPSVHVNLDHTRGQQTDVVYLGASTVGMVAPVPKVGPFKFIAAYYWVLGRQEGGLVNPNEQTVNAHMALADLGYPIQAGGGIEVFPHVGAFFASGDRDPTNDHATGFDAIYDYVDAWGFNHFIIRNRINLARGSLTREHSGLFTFRGFDEPQNFVNPGIVAANLGLTTKWTSQFTTDANVGPAFLPSDEVPELILGRHIGHTVGWAFNVNGTYKFTDWLSLMGGIAGFAPQEAAEHIFLGRTTALDFLLMLKVRV
jgi:hypothetical protein